MKTRVELYQFRHESEVWNLTNHRKAITYNAIEYLPIRGLSRSEIENENIEKCEIEVVFPQPYDLLNSNNESLSQLFINKIFYQGVHLEIFELDDSIPLVLFKGRVVRPSFDDNDNTMTLSCATADSEFKQTILTRKYQKTCPNAIYDRFCGLKIEEWSFEARILSVIDTAFSYEVMPTQIIEADGTPLFNSQGKPVLEIKTYSDDFLTAGILIKNGVYTWLVHKGLMYRKHHNLKAGDVVRLAAGCNQSRKMCHEKFNNHVRFGGFINIPNEGTVYTQLIK